MMPEMQVGEKEALRRENNELRQRIREKKYRIAKLKQALREIRTEAVNYGSFDWIATRAGEVLGEGVSKVEVEK